MRHLVLLRHGETQWSVTGQHTSHTDIGLTEYGKQQAAALGRMLAGRTFASVWCSPLRRARRTAELAGLTVTGYADNLREWDYGRYEGLTTEQIHTERPGWSLWTDGAPDGEAPEAVARRVDAVLATVGGDKVGGDEVGGDEVGGDEAGGDEAGGGDVLLVAHGHILRVLAARWLGLEVAAGAMFALSAGALCELGHERGRPILLQWNLPPTPHLPPIMAPGT